MTAIPADVVERMVALVRAIATDGAKWKEGYKEWGEARAISALLPKPIDPDLIEARQACAAEMRVHMGGGDWMSHQADETLAGKNDHMLEMKVALAGIKRGRELERSAK